MKHPVALAVGVNGWTAIATAAGVLVALGIGVFGIITRWRFAVRAQAEQVAAWIVTDRGEQIGETHHGVQWTAVELSNPSQQPVYDVGAVLVFRAGAAPHTGRDWADLGLEQALAMITLIAQLPPGVHRHRLRDPGNAPMGSGGIMLVEIAFTDQAGRHWLRSATGKLTRLRQDAIDHYRLPRPVSYEPLGADPPI